MSMSFEYRALDLLADYEARFAYFPSIFATHIEGTKNGEVAVAFVNFVDAMCRDAAVKLGDPLGKEEFANRLGELNEQEIKGIKLMSDLGVWTHLTMSVYTYFVTRQRITEDQRSLDRFVKLIDDEISIRAC